MLNEQKYIDLYEYHLDGFKQTKGNQYIGCCVWHDDTKPSLSINVSTGQYKCFSCDAKGNAIEFCKHQGIDPSPYYSEEYKRNEGNVNKTTVKQRAMSDKTDINRHIKDLTDKMKEYAVEYPENKGYDVLILNKIGKDSNGARTFPYFKDGKVIGIKHHKSKNKNGEPKKPWWEGDGSYKWYLGWLLDTYDVNEVLLICEGEKDALRLRERSFNVVSASAGAGSVPPIPDKFKEFKRIIIIYDNDEAGFNGARACAEKIYRSTRTRPYIAQWSEGLPDGYDCSDDKSGNEINEALDRSIQYEHIIPKNIGGFTIMTDVETSQRTPKPTEWLIENILPKRFNSVIAGTTGSKKSYWTMQLGMCLANEESEFCGNKIHAKGIKVLYVDCEIGEEEYTRRYHRIKNHMNWKDNGNWLGISKSGTTMDIYKTVHEICEHHFNPDLIIIDSLYNSTGESDLSKSSPMSKVTNELVKYKDLYDTTILVVAHFNKGGDEMGLNMTRMSGSSVLQNWIEWVCLMTKTNVSNFNLWQVAKTRGTYHDQSIIGLEFSDFWFTTKGVVEDWKHFLLSDQKKAKWSTVLDDLPNEFDTQQWLNVFSTKNPTMSERTGSNWLAEVILTPMVERLSQGIYRKGLGIIDENNIDEG
tara:strand:- start:240 stop:2162 length:1923 start_codon:yes stop_codon:yes gene_type:complete